MQRVSTRPNKTMEGSAAVSVFIIAETGSVPDGSVGQAVALAIAASNAGADCIKTQDHRWQPIPVGSRHPDWMRYPEHETRAAYMARQSSWTDGDWFNFYSTVRDMGKQHIVSPFSVEALAWHLDNNTIDGIKIASGQVTNRALLLMARESGLPVYVSNGMGTEADLDRAREALLGSGGTVTYLHCVSEYPCSPESLCFSDMEWMSKVEGNWGLSDHSLGMAAGLAAVTLGATVVERHVCWDRRGYGSDCGHSLTIDEFAAFCREVRWLEAALSSSVDKDELATQLTATRAQFLHREPEDAGWRDQP